MVIQGPYYRITPISDTSPLFDLELLRDIGGKNPRQEFKVEGYGLPLVTVLEKLCQYTVNKKFKEEVITLKEYIDEYKKARTSLEKEVSRPEVE